MKKWGFLLFLLMLLTLPFIKIESFFEPRVVIQKYNQSEYNEIENRNSESTYKKEIAEEQIYQGNLLLVNSKYPVHPESIKSDVINLSNQNELARDFGVIDNDIYLSEEIAHKFSEMINAAENEGVRNFSITSGYRDFEKQNKLYQEMGSAYALPAGYSEHNLGLSLDVGSTQEKMAVAAEGKWIEKNAWKYGFVLRYPKDKTNVTGIQFEPWHIRYVGFPHSAIMKEKNFALEEYLEYLKEEKHISAKINGKSYEITYYPVSQSRSINVNSQMHYEISGNNMDGVIVTVYD
ncbi:VanY-A/VanY-F/VanY-M family D-Ala-D-Ala carboxypeptidase [Bacillus sp. OAE603]|uniref:VanY-A/VanY-F/VanY-M family D-Ala-D-Ala carboxypeptidase n=1 Tax=Gottfriedia sp. OAE603 TaxID=2663872 RepID=UPI00178A5B9A